MPQVYLTTFCRATFFAAATSTSPGGLHERPVEPASIQRLGPAGAPPGCRDRLSPPRQPEARHVEDAAVGSDACGPAVAAESSLHRQQARRDRKSTRLNSSHGYISYAVFCSKKKTNYSYQRSSAAYGLI